MNEAEPDVDRPPVDLITEDANDNPDEVEDDGLGETPAEVIDPLDVDEVEEPEGETHPSVGHEPITEPRED